MVNVDELAAAAAAKLRGRVTAAMVRQAIAAAIALAVEQTVTEAETIVRSRLVLGEVAADGRLLPTWLRKMLARNAVDIERRLAALRPSHAADASADRL